MKTHSTRWKGSSAPRKQRKYRVTAPLHIKQHFMHVHLSKDLRKKWQCRSVQLRHGDKVQVVRGEFRKQSGKVEEVDVKRSRVFVAKIERTKKDGTKTRVPIDPSNLLIIELTQEDSRRLKRKASQSPAGGKAAASPPKEKKGKEQAP